MMMNNSRMMLNSATRLELWTDQFNDSLYVALDKSRADGSEFEDETLALVEGFEDATARFKERVEDNEVIASDVENLLSRALLVEAAMSKAPAVPMARTDWMQIKQLLNDIAKTNNVVWVWTLDANPYWKNPAAAERIVDRLEDRTDGAIIHTDRGSQYASVEFRRLLYIHGFWQSMSGKGNCYDNAQAESFFS